MSGDDATAAALLGLSLLALVMALYACLLARRGVPGPRGPAGPSGPAGPGMVDTKIADDGSRPLPDAWVVWP